MNIFLLEAFVTLAETLNYTKASQILYTTQPNLSRHIGNLEDELGMQLFERNRRNVKLTLAGQSYYEDAKAVLALNESAVNKARNIDKGIEGVIDIGYLGTALTGHLPRIVNQFKKHNPKIVLNLLDYTFSPLVEALKEGTIDVALTLDRELDNIPNLEKKFLFADDMCLVMHKSHPMADKESVNLTDFASEPFVMMDPKVSMLDFEMVAGMCEARGFIPNTVQQVNTLQNIMMMVECRVGVSILAGHMGQFATEDLRFVKIDGFDSYFKMICAWRRDSNPCIHKLLETIDNCTQLH